jgi:hypothetical protein
MCTLMWLLYLKNRSSYRMVISWSKANITIQITYENINLLNKLRKIWKCIVAYYKGKGWPQKFCHMHKGFQVQLRTCEQPLPLIFYPIYALNWKNEQQRSKMLLYWNILWDEYLARALKQRKYPASVFSLP